MTQLVECLPSNHEDPCLIPRICIKKSGFRASICNLSTGEVEEGHLKAWWPVSPALLVKSIPKGEVQSQKNDVDGFPRNQQEADLWDSHISAYTCTPAFHMNTHTPACTHMHTCKRTIHDEISQEISV